MLWKERTRGSLKFKLKIIVRSQYFKQFAPFSLHIFSYGEWGITYFFNRVNKPALRRYKVGKTGFRRTNAPPSKPGFYHQRLVDKTNFEGLLGEYFMKLTPPLTPTVEGEREYIATAILVRSQLTLGRGGGGGRLSRVERYSRGLRPLTPTVFAP